MSSDPFSQVGISLQIVVIEEPLTYINHSKPDDISICDRKPIAFHAIIDPKLTIIEAKKMDFYEGCLSMRGYMASVPPEINVNVKALNEHDEKIVIHAQGWYARILQHEVDHLNGILYIDRMHTKTLTTDTNYKLIKAVKCDVD